ncbi:uncharacterized, partial [Tachysurus ichikawai]
MPRNNEEPRGIIWNPLEPMRNTKKHQGMLRNNEEPRGIIWNP